MGSKSKTTSTSTTTNPYAVQSYNSAVAQLGNSTYKPLTGDSITSYMSPYTSSVIDATLARSGQERQQALNANQDQAIKSGAFGGTGLSVQNALTNGQYDLNDQQTIANLNNQNYLQALGVASSENSAMNQYPLALQALLGQLAQGTTTNSNGTSTQSSPLNFGNILSGFGSAASGLGALGMKI